MARHRARMAWCGIAAAVAVALCPPEAAAAIFRCTGPAGELLYSNVGCPPGYSLHTISEENPAPNRDPVPPGPKEIDAVEAAPEPTAPRREREAVDAECSQGAFRTEDGPLAIPVFFTNTGPRVCLRVKFYCLWGLGYGLAFYQQSDTGVYEGRIDAGATVRVGEMRPSGPMAGDVSWSWCRITR